MFAKQIWRMHTHPHSLLVKCYKAKYFPNCDVLKAPIGYSPSYAWMSMQSSTWILNKGCCWRIGDGTQININTDNWLPHNNGFKPIYYNPNGPPLVKDLLIDIPYDWNHNLIQEHFLLMDSLQILQLPIIHPSKSDALMWMYDLSGCYTVKSGYSAIQTWKSTNNKDPSSSSVNHTLWQKLWNLNTIPRHKTLLLRILNNSLPVRTNLLRRGVQCPIFCPRCNIKGETTSNLFMRCAHLERVWFGSQLTVHMPNNQNQHFTEWLTYIILNKDSNIAIQVGAITYSLWHARNQVVYEDLLVPEVTIIQRVVSSLLAYLHANSKCHEEASRSTNPSVSSSTTHNRISASTRKRWMRLEPGFVKANSDANLQVSGKWGLSCIIRDEEGKLKVSST